MKEIEKPKRRPRYHGTHPKKFDQKYKEHAPERYAEDVAKVLASGKTPAGMHVPIMLREILDTLRIQVGETAVDCTLGYGGHAREMLAAVQPRGKLIALDQDGVELSKSEARLRALGFPEGTFEARHSNFAGLARILNAEGADAILADLGLSSMQMDDPARGFTYKWDAPLDMRMNTRRGLDASAVIGRADERMLATWLLENADEPHATELANAIARARPITTTVQLAEIVRGTLKKLARGIRDNEVENSIRRVFQAIRIVVNDEFGALKMFLKNLPVCLRPGGRVAILTFHSGEDRRVKQAFKEGLRAGDFSAIADEVVRASPEERRANPRSSAAKLRWAVRA